MADDREVLRILWDGRIPVCFTLNADEVFTLEQPEPFYVSLLAFMQYFGSEKVYYLISQATMVVYAPINVKREGGGGGR